MHVKAIIEMFNGTAFNLHLVNVYGNQSIDLQCRSIEKGIFSLIEKTGSKPT